MTRPVLNRRWRHCYILAAGFLTSTALLAASSAFSQDGVGIDPREKLRNDPEYARLYHDGKAFLALPAAKQEAMRKLHDELEKRPRAERERLKDTLRRYADWVDKLPGKERRSVVNAPNKQARLQAIKRLREKEWIARQPKALRQFLEKPPAVAAASVVGLLAGAPRQMRPLALAAALMTESPALMRAATIARLKREDLRKARDWTIAFRHWADLINQEPLPTRAADFGFDVQTFVKEYLRPMLDKQELARLDQAEGHWPLYAATLVELADKHPAALPQKHGPTAFKSLPVDVQKRIEGKKFKEGKKKDWDQFFRKADNVKPAEARLAAVMPPRDQTPSIKFTCVVANFVHTKKNGGLNHELWAARPKEMSAPMRLFLEPKGPFWLKLSAEEKADLRVAEGHWPEYPLKVKELGEKYGFRPPWQTLPEIKGKPDLWDKYRIKPHNRVEAPVVLRAKPEVARAEPRLPWRRLEEGEDAAPRLFSVQALPRSNRGQRDGPADLPLSFLPLDRPIERIPLDRHAARLLD